jgi:hypothetical protein
MVYTMSMTNTLHTIEKDAADLQPADEIVWTHGEVSFVKNVYPSPEGVMVLLNYDTKPLCFSEGSRVAIKVDPSELHIYDRIAIASGTTREDAEDLDTFLREAGLNIQTHGDAEKIVKAGQALGFEVKR